MNNWKQKQRWIDFTFRSVFQVYSVQEIIIIIVAPKWQITQNKLKILRSKTKILELLSCFNQVPLLPCPIIIYCQTQLDYLSIRWSQTSKNKLEITLNTGKQSAGSSLCQFVLSIIVCHKKIIFLFEQYLVPTYLKPLLNISNAGIVNKAQSQCRQEMMRSWTWTMNSCCAVGTIQKTAKKFDRSGDCYSLVIWIWKKKRKPWMNYYYYMCLYGFGTKAKHKANNLVYRIPGLFSL